MRYPEFLNKGKIGVCAPSLGCTINPYLKRCENATKTLTKKGHEIAFSESCFEQEKCRSAPAEVRAKEFMEMYLREDVDAVISMAGGEFMMEILPYINFKKLANSKPKFYAGSSDNTNLTFLLTVNCDIASIYGVCFPTYGMKKWHQAVKDNYDLLTGKKLAFSNYKKYELDNPHKKEEGHELDGYHCTEKVKWEILTGENEVNVQGRIIGGCLDVLTHMVGTKFLKIDDFNKRYKDDGVIWYLEACDLNVLEQSRSLWLLKQNGWFKNVKAFLIGRPRISETLMDIDCKEAVISQLKEFNVPIIMDIDVGHVAPAMPILNGSMAKVSVKKGKGNVEFLLI